MYTVRKHIQTYGVIDIDTNGRETKIPLLINNLKKAKRIAEYWDGYVVKLN